MHVGVYVKCNFEKIKTIRKAYGCPTHGTYRSREWLYCPTCGTESGTIDEVCMSNPNMYGIMGDYARLTAVLVGCQLYMVSYDYTDGTSFSNQDGEIVLDMSVMYKAMLAFHRLYDGEIEKLRSYGPIEVHFGLLHLDKV